MRTSNVLSVLLGAGLIWGCASVDEAAAPSAPEAPRAPAATEAPKAPEPPAPPQTATSGFTPDASLALCPRESVSNAPPHTGEDRVLTNFSPFVRVKGVKLAVVPTNNACLSSGFGLRNGKLHKGIDVQNDPAEMVYSGAAGTIREAGWREDDYGNYVVIDHGDFVTLYSHLANLEAGVKVDALRCPTASRWG